MGEIRVKSSEVSGQDLRVKFGSQGLWCHVRSLEFVLPGTTVKM